MAQLPERSGRERVDKADAMQRICPPLISDDEDGSFQCTRWMQECKRCPLLSFCCLPCVQNRFSASEWMQAWLLAHWLPEPHCQFDNMPPYLCGSVMKNVCVRDRQCPTEGHVGCGYASSIVSGGEQNLSAALQAQSAHVLAQHPYCNVMAVYVCGVKMVVRMRPRLWDG